MFKVLSQSFKLKGIFSLWGDDTEVGILASILLMLVEISYTVNDSLKGPQWVTLENRSRNIS